MVEDVIDVERRGGGEVEEGERWILVMGVDIGDGC